jgi:hypothetical protein
MENTAKTRNEVVLLALGFSDPSENENNPGLWFNKYFDGIEVELDSNNWIVTGISSTFVSRGTGPAALATAITQQLECIMDVLADEELGIQ